ncbi:MAG: AAA family ATPase [Ignavibacteria bacterium]|nr:AAA family ATPase [Ignavibacteria bacterium]
MELLHGAFLRCTKGGKEVILIRGQSGIGKSALLRHFSPFVSEQEGVFARGDFEDAGQIRPYAGMLQSLRAVASRLRASADGDVQRLNAALRDALGTNDVVLLRLLPELRQSAETPDHDTADADAMGHLRVSHAVAAFVRAAATVFPIALCLDDAQNADAGSLDLLEELLLDPRVASLLVVVTYRDGDMPMDHPLLAIAERVRQSGCRVAELPLEPLVEDDIRLLLAETLGDERDETAALARVLQLKTGGSPFHLRHLLTSLFEDGMLVFDRAAGVWRWDVERINGLAVTRNIAELLAGSLARLDERAREALYVAACAGMEFDVPILAGVLALRVTEVLPLLGRPLEEGLLVPTGPVRGILRDEARGGTSDFLSGAYAMRYRFAHSRVHAVALTASGGRDVSRTQYEIGRAMLAEEGEDPHDDALFDIVARLNAGVSWLETAAERRCLATLNLRAAEHARRSGATGAARAMYATGETLLPAEAWRVDRDLLFALQRGRAECDYLLGNFGSSEALFDALLERAESDEEFMSVVTTKMALCTNVGRYADAIALAIDALHRFGVHLDASVRDDEALRMLTGRRASFEGPDIPSLVMLPELRDPAMRHAMSLFEHAGAAAYLTRPALYAVFCMEMVSISLQHGNTAASSYGYSGLGVLLGAFLGNHQAAYAYGELGVEVARRFGDAAALCRSTMMLGGFISHWSRPAEDDLPLLASSHRLGVESGALIFAGYSLLLETYAQFFIGTRLDALASRISMHIGFLERSGEDRGLLTLRMLGQVCRNLQGATSGLASLTDATYDEAAAEAQMVAAPTAVPLLVFLVNKLRLLCLHRQFEEALRIADRAERIATAASGMLVIAEFRAWEAFAVIGRMGEAAPAERAALLPRARRGLDMFKGWMRHCPQNFEDKWALLAAELAAMEDNRSDAAELYERAIDAARRARFTHAEAHACECAARFHLARGHQERGRGLLIEALHAYDAWGASAKVRALLREFPEAAERGEGGEMMAFDTTTTASAFLDAASLMKTSQAISREILLPDLLRKMMRILIENAGAQRGVLLLEQNGAWHMDAEARVGKEPASILAAIPLNRCRDVPSSIILRAARSREPLRLDDPAQLEEFRHDPVLRNHAPRSVLCIPLLSGGVLLGALYLEHLSTAGAFPVSRVESLLVLVRQMAISLQNALLYRQLEEALTVAREVENAKRESEVHRRASEMEHRKNREIQAAYEQLKTTQSQLIHAEKMASLGALTAGISHEILNPVNFVTSFAELSMEAVEELRASLRNASDPPSRDTLLRALDDVFEQSRHIREHGLRAAAIVRGMQLHARKTTGVRERVALNALVSAAVSLALHGIAGEATPLPVEVSASYEEAPLDCEVDVQGVSRAILNILQNALYVLAEKHAASKDGFAPRLSVRTAMNDGMAEVRIADNGGGIPYGILEKIFEPFYTTKPSGTGTGLGLSMSYEIIVKGHGGSLHAENGPEGAVFIVSLPLFLARPAFILQD